MTTQQPFTMIVLRALGAAQSLPFIGKHLLQRNIIKFGIPGALAAGRHAKSVFRDEAKVIELADTLIRRTRHPRLMLWVAWLVINADGEIADAESLLFQRLTRLVRERHQVDDEQLANVVTIDPDEVGTPSTPSLEISVTSSTPPNGSPPSTEISTPMRRQSSPGYEIAASDASPRCTDPRRLRSALR
ncbi:hypothetical protein OOK27_47895 [Streptomyces canus]|uniref:hypothetical protein n=1 Tax=Streptomyces canus TaxID=58343 RepID=UPI0022538AE9|nr:hypothetical protein [Streptomyces canus]MCX5261767.1 hypothetical protein [Streptomyces canus]